MAFCSHKSVRLFSPAFIRNVVIGTESFNKKFIMTSCSRVEKVLEKLQKNPFFDKYAEKIAKYQQTNPDEFLHRVESREQKLQKEKDKQEEKSKFYRSQAKPQLEQDKQPRQARLDDIMKVDMIQDKTKNEIIDIWKSYHNDKDYICGILTVDQFDKMFSRGKQYSTFLLPLPRKEGYEFIVSQFYGLEVHMTPLLWYQAHKENAPECLTMVHYTEFKDDKGIILMRGEFDSKTINVQEAQCLANELQLYYCTENSRRLQLLETFTRKPDEFKHMDLIAQLETLDLHMAVHALKEPIHSSWTFPFPIKRTQSSWTYYVRKNHFSHNASEKMYITTPIFYVNGAPHIGHLYTAVLADTVARFNSMQGHSVYLCTGTDEHGTKVQKAADAAAIPTIEYCNQISHQFLKLCNTFDVKYSDFIRTSEERHKKAVHHFWNRLEKNGHIYLGKYAGWYNETEEAFVSNKDVVKQESVITKTTEMRTTSGDLVEWMEEESYKFRLTSFIDDLQYWLKQENVIYPRIYRNALNSSLEDIQDLSISRPIKRVPWAIPTPHDKSHTIYVWFDALVNYLTSVGYPDDSFREFWPPTIQILGKDILKFHGIYWPAFLMAAGLEPPKLLLCHGHWTVNKYKMSKSKGNVISPFKVADEMTPEGLRYYIMKQGVIDTNSIYNPVKIIETINTDLANTLGNLVNRCFGKTINPEKVIPDPVECISILKSDIAITNIKALEELSAKTEKFYKAYQVHHAIETTIEMLHIANQMFNHHKPWLLYNSEDPDSIKKLEAVISLSLESVRVAVLTLYPVMPKLSSELLDFLQVPIENRTWEDTKPLHLTSDIKGSKHISKDMLFFKKIKI